MQVIGMALNGFDWPSVNVLNFTAEPTYSYENNSFILTIIVDPSSAAMNVLVYNILAVNSNYNTIVDLQSPCINQYYCRLRPLSDKHHLPYPRLHSKLQLHHCLQPHLHRRNRGDVLPPIDN